MVDGYLVLAIAGLAVVTVMARGFFLWSSSDWHMPLWLEAGLRYAPVAALAAIVAPALLMDSTGQWSASWADGRIFGAVSGVAWYGWRRDILGTIACGTAVMMLCRWWSGLT